MAGANETEFLEQQIRVYVLAPLSAVIDAHVGHVVEDSHSSNPQQERRARRGRQEGTARPGVPGGEVFHRRLGSECVP